MKDIYQVIIRPIMTEKSERGRLSNRCYCFEVHPDANKMDVKMAVEKLLKVRVEKVNIVKIKGKRKRWGRIEGKRKDIKKAYVKVREGDKIDILEGA